MSGEYQYQEYPKWMYHHKRCPEGKIFESAPEVSSAGRGWVDPPVKFPKPSAVSKAAVVAFKWARDKWAKLATVVGTLIIVAVKPFSS